MGYWDRYMIIRMLRRGIKVFGVGNKFGIKIEFSYNI